MDWGPSITWSGIEKKGDNWETGGNIEEHNLQQTTDTNKMGALPHNIKELDIFVIAFFLDNNWLQADSEACRDRGSRGSNICHKFSCNHCCKSEPMGNMLYLKWYTLLYSPDPIPWGNGMGLIAYPLTFTCEWQAVAHRIAPGTQ